MIKLDEYLKLGLTGSKTETVIAEMTVGALVPGMPMVYSTPYMITVMEVVADRSVFPHLPDGWISVGTRVDVQHLKATPVGFEVMTTSEVVEVSEREIRFKVTASDGIDLIGEGYHYRAVVDRERFLRGIDNKIAANPV